MSDEWGPWIMHDMSGCPVMGQYVHVVASCGREKIGFARSAHLNTPGLSAWLPNPRRVVVKYRVRRPLGLSILEGILAKVNEKGEVEELA